MDLRRFMSGVTFVIIGGLLLANTVGVLPWSVWWNILSLWPLLLVSAGLDVIGNSQGAQWVRALSSLVVIGGLLFGALVMPAATGPRFVPWVDAGSEPYAGALPANGAPAEATMIVKEGASDISLGSTDAAFVGIRGRAAPPVPDISVADSKGSATAITIARPQAGTGIVGGSSLSIGLGEGTRWLSVALETGAANLEADLSGLQVDAFTLKTGASTATVKLGERGPLTAEFQTGLSTVNVEVPRDATVTVIDRSALVAKDLPGFTPSQEGGGTVWRRAGTSPTGGPAITVILKMALGAASVHTY